jgi:hypothetical protein
MSTGHASAATAKNVLQVTPQAGSGAAAVGRATALSCRRRHCQALFEIFSRPQGTKKEVRKRKADLSPCRIRPLTNGEAKTS